MPGRHGSSKQRLFSDGVKSEERWRQIVSAQFNVDLAITQELLESTTLAPAAASG